MNMLRKAVVTGVIGSAAGTTWLLSSSKLVSPIPQHEALWQSDCLRKFNHFDNPVLEDVCIKRIPLSKIRRELRNDEAALTLEFCRGVWSGWAFTPQRWLFTKLYRTPENSHLIFSKQGIAESGFEIGSEFIDQFEVVERTSNKITVREGGSPRDPSPRVMDGLIITTVRVDHATEEVELSLSTRLFRGQENVTDGSMPVPYFIEVIHGLYARALVVCGSQALI